MDRYTERVKEVLAQQITELEDVKGNLVKTWINEFTFLVFDDGRWACLTWYAWPEGGGGTALESDRPDIYDLWMAELLTKQEYAGQLDQSKDYNVEQQELSDKKQLRRLQARYGKR